VRAHDDIRHKMSQRDVDMRMGTYACALERIRNGARLRGHW